MSPMLALALISATLLAISPRLAAAGAEPSVTPSAATVPLPEAGSPERRMLEALNTERVRQGITPVAWSPELGTAAALHSADMAAKGYFDHYGSDGSDQQQRAARAGYVVPPASGWMVIEAVTGKPTVEGALGWLLSDGVHRRVVLRTVWREVGIGYAAAGSTSYWTLDFGCRPNVLPVFADPSADNQSISLTFTNENCAASGGGPDQMGRATEYMLSSSADFREAIWQPFVDVRQVPPPTNGELNVRLRDASNRMSAPVQVSLDGVKASGSLPTPSPVPSSTPTPTTVRTSTRASTPTATPSPTARPSPTPSPTPAPEEPAP